MPSTLPKHIKSPFLRLFSALEFVLCVVITVSTTIALGQEIFHMVVNRTVLLSDLLLMFIYLEVLAMVHQFVTIGKIPVRYPIYIAIMAIARFITLGMKEIDGPYVAWLSFSAFILAAATVLLRLGHHYWPYNDDMEFNKNNKYEEKSID